MLGHLAPTLPGSGLLIKISELPSVQENDLALIAADKADDIQFMQSR
jgi:hypothetical protein